jgi:hypothetical protein
MIIYKDVAQPTIIITVTTLLLSWDSHRRVSAMARSVQHRKGDVWVYVTSVTVARGLDPTTLRGRGLWTMVGDLCLVRRRTCGLKRKTHCHPDQ